MNVSCDIIRDLLPLYAEDMVSQASRELVDGHLCGCEACGKELEKLKKAAQIPVEVDTGALKKVEHTIRKKRILAVITVLLAAVTLCAGVALLLDARIYLTAEQAVESVEALEDGSIRIQWSSKIPITGFSAFADGVDSDGNYGIIACTRLGSLLFSGERVSYAQTRLGGLLFPGERLSYAQMPEDVRSILTEEEYNARFDNASIIGGAAARNVWYCSAKDGKGETLLWDAGNPYPEAQLKDVNYHLAYYCGGLAVIAAAMAGLAFALRKKRAGKWILYGAVLVGCVSLSTVICCAGQFMELWGEFTQTFQDSWILAVPMYAACLCLLKLHEWSRRDRGI